MPKYNPNLDPKTKAKLRHREITGLLAGVVLTILMVIGYSSNNQRLFWYGIIANLIILNLVNRIQKQLYPNKPGHFKFDFKIEKNHVPSDQTPSKNRLLDQYLTESKKLELKNRKNGQMITQTQQKLAQTNDETLKAQYLEQLKQLKAEQKQLVRNLRELANKINQL